MTKEKLFLICYSPLYYQKEMETTGWKTEITCEIMYLNHFCFFVLGLDILSLSNLDNSITMMREVPLILVVLVCPMAEDLLSKLHILIKVYLNYIMLRKVISMYNYKYFLGLLTVLATLLMTLLMSLVHDVLDNTYCYFILK